MAEAEPKKRKDFFATPNAVIDTGLWTCMRPSEKDVYIVLGRHANYNSGLAYPGVRTIAEESGHCLEVVCKATAQLVVYGLIEKIRTGPDFKFRMAYRVLEEPVIEANIIPWRTEQRKRKKDKKTGKFIPIPSRTESPIVPSHTEPAIVPSRTAQKERERERKKLTIKPKHTSPPRRKTKGKKATGEEAFAEARKLYGPKAMAEAQAKIEKEANQ